MRLLVLVSYVGMAVWLLVAAVLRIRIQLAAGLDLDVIPFISGSIGLIALLLLAPLHGDRRSRDEDRRSEDVVDGWPNPEPRE